MIQNLNEVLWCNLRDKLLFIRKHLALNLCDEQLRTQVIGIFLLHLYICYQLIKIRYCYGRKNLHCFDALNIWKHLIFEQLMSFVWLCVSQSEKSEKFLVPRCDKISKLRVVLFLKDLKHLEWIVSFLIFNSILLLVIYCLNGDIKEFETPVVYASMNVIIFVSSKVKDEPAKKLSSSIFFSKVKCFFVSTSVF